MIRIHRGYYRGWYNDNGKRKITVMYDVLRTWNWKTKQEGWGFGLWDAQYRDSQIYRYKRDAVIAAKRYIDTMWPKESIPPFLTTAPWMYGPSDVFDHRLDID